MRASPLKTLVARILVAAILLVGMSSFAQAAPIQLAFIVDASGSIGSTNFATMRTGIANAFTSVLPIDGSVEVTLVRFDSSATTIIAPTVVDSAATRAALAALVVGMAYTGGTTNMAAGIALATSLVTGSSNYVRDGSGQMVYNVVTDGIPDSTTAAVNARNAAITAGMDELDAEFIGTVGSSGYNFLLNSLVYPGPGHPAPPYTPGFVVPVSFANFEAAFTAKLEAVTQPPSVPEPTTMLLLGSGLVGLVIRHRAKSKTNS